MTAETYKSSGRKAAPSDGRKAAPSDGRKAAPSDGRKAPGAFRTISEVATDLDIPQHVLRFWESKFAQIKPVKRGGGRRYYRPEDVDLLRAIQALLYDDKYTIKGAQQLIREQGVKSIIQNFGGFSGSAAMVAAQSDAPDGGGQPGDAESDALREVLRELRAIRDDLMRLGQ